MSKWYRLDNAAKIFPPSKNRYDPKIFRFSISLKENVDSKTLSEALKKTLDEYPVFRAVLKRGFFWYYLEETDIKVLVSEEHNRPCSIIEGPALFQVTYYKKRINLEVNHALTDGTGTLMFLKSLVAYYLDMKYKIKSNEIINKASIKETSLDSFKKYKSGKKIKISGKNKIAYQIKDEKYHENRLKIIEGIVSVKKVLDLAKSYDVSLTVYLASVLIKSIGDAMDVKDWGKDIAIAIPVNLRNYYPSYTVRNFFNAVNVRYNYNGEDLVDIIKEIDKQLKVSLSKENIRNKMNSMARLEDIFVIRLIPIFVKDFILKYAYKFSDFSETMTLSNVGVINMPDAYQSYIDYFSVFMSTSRIQLCLCSYLDNLVFSFTSQFVNSEIEKNFFRFFTSQGINVIINTNDLEGANNNA